MPFFTPPLRQMPSPPTSGLGVGRSRIILFFTSKSSVAEIIYDLINNWQRSLVDAELATIILAGMIHKTQSFRLPNLAPKTLAITSDLIDLGADREKIVANFYCTKKIATLNGCFIIVL